MFHILQSQNLPYSLEWYKAHLLCQNVNKDQLSAPPPPRLYSVIEKHDGRSTSYERDTNERRNIYSCVIRQCHELCPFVKHCFGSANGVANTILFTSIYAFSAPHFIRDRLQALARLIFYCYAGLKVQLRKDKKCRLSRSVLCLLNFEYSFVIFYYKAFHSVVDK